MMLVIALIPICYILIQCSKLGQDCNSFVQEFQSLYIKYFQEILQEVMKLKNYRGI